MSQARSRHIVFRSAGQRIVQSISASLLLLCGVLQTGCMDKDVDEIRTSEQMLMARSRFLHNPRSVTSSFTEVKFCFSSSVATRRSLARFRMAFQNAANQWEAATSGRLIIGEIDECGEGIPIYADEEEALGRTRGLGWSTQWIRLNPSLSDEPSKASFIAAHEMGHALGFTHEHMHDDSNCDRRQAGDLRGDLSWDPYDPWSIMDYCSIDISGWTYDNLLSATDKEIARRIYGGPKKYVGSDQEFMIRSQLDGYFLKTFETSDVVQAMDPGSKWVVENYDNPGQPLTYDDRVALRYGPSGKYLRVETGTRHSGRIPTYAVEMGPRTAWRIRGFKDTDHKVEVNQAFALSKTLTFPGAVEGCNWFKEGDCKVRVFVTTQPQPQGEGLVVTLTSRKSTTPSKSDDALWRAMGPM